MSVSVVMYVIESAGLEGGKGCWKAFAAETDFPSLSAEQTNDLRPRLPGWRA